MTILIPAYKPNQRLLDLIDAIKKADVARDYRIVVVDDGSGPAYREVLEAVRLRGCTVLFHDRNMGRGRALKTGFAYIRAQGERDGVVTADCDARNAPADILRIAAAVKAERSAEASMLYRSIICADCDADCFDPQTGSRTGNCPGNWSGGCGLRYVTNGSADLGGHHNAIILGSSRPSAGKPLRKRFGSAVTRGLYRFVSGIGVADIQTGLRGYPMDTVHFALATPGDRNDYEMNILLEAPKWGIPLRELAVQADPPARERASGVRTIRDAFRAVLPILKFGAASAISALIDFVLLLALQRATGSLLQAVVLARAASASFNFIVNRNLVFRMETDVRQAYSPAFARYAGLAMTIMLLNYVLLHLLNETAGIALPLAKLLTESILYLASYLTQSRYVFAQRRAAQTAGAN